MAVVLRDLRTLSALESLDESDVAGARAWGIEIDCEPGVARRLAEISIMAACENGLLSERVLDAVLSYTSSGVGVIIEVPAETVIDPGAALLTAANCDAELALLPPIGADHLARTAYLDRLEAFTRLWLASGHGGGGGVLLPAQGYLQVLIGEVFGHTPARLTDDVYMEQRFVRAMGAELMGEAKQRIRRVVHASFGGEAAFERFAHSLASAVGQRVAEMAAVLDTPREKAH